MQPIVLVLTFIVIAYIIAERAFRIRRKSFESIFFFIHGLEFIFLGAVCGPHLLGVLTHEMINAFSPIIQIALCWIGLIFGLQFRLQDLRMLSLGNYAIAFVESTVALVVISATVFFLVGVDLSIALALGAILSPSAPGVIASVTRLDRAHGTMTRLLRYVSSSDAFVGLLAFGTLLALLNFNQFHGTSEFSGWQWLLLSLGVGMIMALLFHLLLSLRLTDNERLALTVGGVILSAGIVSLLHLSALFCNFILGILLANAHVRYDKLYRLLAVAEKPIYGMLLIIAGALWWPSLPILFVVAVLILGRYLGKSLGGFLGLKLYRVPSRHPFLFGSALLAQGGMSIAMVIDFHVVFASPIDERLVTIIVTSFLIFGVVSLFTVRNVLKAEGEIE